ncbi:FAD dependent oxidoreductase [Colletotrichum musicola]|uniref:FAD dependent oxidoreductase n=1 Tax=Colletotrichum musicola TaxID=2175873 RepID=A0A8H6IVU3_9PEZI|nr:FAD dependent oxidoreductase [Colletotrichum musicola]
MLGFGNKHIEVKTQHGSTVVCDHAVKATNVPLQKLSIVAEMEYNRTYCIAIRVPKSSVEDCLAYDTAEEYKYFKSTKCDSDSDYIILGGLDHKVGQEDAGAVDYRLSDQIFKPVDYMAFIGLNQACKRTHTLKMALPMESSPASSLPTTSTGRRTAGLGYAPQNERCRFLGRQSSW